MRLMLIIFIVSLIVSCTTNKAEEHYNKGQVYLKKNRYKLALQEFERSQKYDPDNVLAEFKRGVSLFKLERDEEAISSFLKVVKSNSEQRNAWFNLAGLYYRNKEYINAIKAAIKSRNNSLYNILKLSHKRLKEQGVKLVIPAEISYADSQKFRDILNECFQEVKEVIEQLKFDPAYDKILEKNVPSVKNYYSQNACYKKLELQRI